MSIPTCPPVFMQYVDDENDWKRACASRAHTRRCQRARTSTFSPPIHDKGTTLRRVTPSKASAREPSSVTPEREHARFQDASVSTCMQKQACARLAMQHSQTLVEYCTNCLRPPYACVHLRRQPMLGGGKAEVRRRPPERQAASGRVPHALGIGK